MTTPSDPEKKIAPEMPEAPTIGSTDSIVESVDPIDNPVLKKIRDAMDQNVQAAMIAGESVPDLMVEGLLGEWPGIDPPGVHPLTDELGEEYMGEMADALYECVPEEIHIWRDTGNENPLPEPKRGKDGRIYFVRVEEFDSNAIIYVVTNEAVFLKWFEEYEKRPKKELTPYIGPDEEILADSSMQEMLRNAKRVLRAFRGYLTSSSSHRVSFEGYVKDYFFEKLKVHGTWKPLVDEILTKEESADYDPLQEKKREFIEKVLREEETWFSYLMAAENSTEFNNVLSELIIACNRSEECPKFNEPEPALTWSRSGYSGGSGGWGEHDDGDSGINLEYFEWQIRAKDYYLGWQYEHAASQYGALSALAKVINDKNGQAKIKKSIDFDTIMEMGRAFGQLKSKRDSFYTSHLEAAHNVDLLEGRKKKGRWYPEVWGTPIQRLGESKKRDPEISAKDKLLADAEALSAKISDYTDNNDLGDELRQEINVYVYADLKGKQEDELRDWMGRASEVLDSIQAAISKIKAEGKRARKLEKSAVPLYEIAQILADCAINLRRAQGALKLLESQLQADYGRERRQNVLKGILGDEDLLSSFYALSKADDVNFVLETAFRLIEKRMSPPSSSEKDVADQGEGTAQKTSPQQSPNTPPLSSEALNSFKKRFGGKGKK